ncbi:MAG: hypothetical protein E7166_03720 [Firmicutes bacterium]|nr:hypothetical protein [Bacillota bacterium]
MDKLNDLLQELEISKVRLAKFLGVSRQMVYNYLDSENLEKMPNDKKLKLFNLLEIESLEDIKNIKVDSDYSMNVEMRLNQGVKKSSNEETTVDLKGLSKSDAETLNNIFTYIKDKLIEDKTDTSSNIFKYLHHFLQSIDNVKELKYILGYVSKSTGFTDPNTFVFNEDQQFLFESIMYSAMTLYNNGGASRSKIAESHRRWEAEIEQKNEEKLSRTQQLNTAKVQALRELGYTEINETNAAEVLEKIAEIQSRSVV